MRTIGFIGLALAIGFATPALSQNAGHGLRADTAPLTPQAPGALDGLTIEARAHRSVGINGINGNDASATVAGARQRLQAAANLRERGDAWRQTGEFEQAIADYTRALDASSRDPDSYYGRGWSYHGAGNIGKAIDDYTEAAKLRPRWSDVYKMRAHARFAQGQLDLAIADLRRAIEYDPKDVYYLTALGVLRLYLGESEVARGNLARALQFKDDPESMLLLYIARGQGGERATGELETNASRLRSRAWPYPLVEFYLGKRSMSDALAAARTDEERCEAHYYIGQLLMLRGSRAEALAAFKQAALVCPKTNLEYGAAAAELRRHRR